MKGIGIKKVRSIPKGNRRFFFEARCEAIPRLSDLRIYGFKVFVFDFVF